MRASDRPSAEETDLVAEDVIAPALGLSPRTLRNMRSRGEGPPYVRISARAIRYSRSQVQAWLDQRTVSPPLDGIPVA